MATEGTSIAFRRFKTTTSAIVFRYSLFITMFFTGLQAASGQNVDATELTTSNRVGQSSANDIAMDQGSIASDSFESTSNANAATLTIEQALQTRGSITFRKTPLQEVVFLLSDLWNINIVAGEKIDGTVSGVFNDAPLRDVLSAILTSSGYGYTAAGNSLVVMPNSEVGTRSPDFRSRTLDLSMRDDAHRTSTIEAAKMLLSPRGEIKSFGHNSVLVIDMPDRIDRVEEMFNGMGGGHGMPSNATNGSGDHSGPTGPPKGVLGNGGVWEPLRIAYFTPQYTEASEMQESLAQALGAGQGNAGGGNAGGSGGASQGGNNSGSTQGPIVAVFKEENRLMVKGTPEELRLAAEAFQQLDVPRAQVRITAMIYDVSLRELEELGVDWSRNFRLNTVDGTPLSEFAGNVTDAVSFSTGGAAGATSVGLRTLTNNFDASAFLNALDTTSESKLLADPSITTADRREATIKIVQRIPIIAGTSPEQSGVVFAQVTFEDAGIILKVTPRISNDNTIELKVQPEYSVVTNFINDNPVIDSRTAETTVRVQNGHMFVLGGLRQRTVNETVGGVPWLRDIKYVGKLFRNHTTEVRDSELVVFLKPELVNPTYSGTPRERVAYNVSTNQLDRIAYASCCPQSPDCHDPNCPNHHPRCRVNGGSQQLAMIGDYGITPYAATHLANDAGFATGETILSGELNLAPSESTPTIAPVDPYYQLYDAGQPSSVAPVTVEPIRPPLSGSIPTVRSYSH